MSLNPRILLIGGHGKLSLLLTPKLLAQSWSVTSLIRDPSQSDEILELGKNQPGNINVVVEDLENIKNVNDAARILGEVEPDWVIWSAGAVYRSPPEKTQAIDGDACTAFIQAAVNTPSITKFLLISALSSRHQRAPWWEDDSWALVQKMNTQILPTYYTAKLGADDALVVLGEKRAGFGWISVRPGGLSDEGEKGKVNLGKTRAVGMISRGDVASVVTALLGKEGVKGWFDVQAGEEEVGSAVDRVWKDGVDTRDGEDWDEVKERLGNVFKGE